MSTENPANDEAKDDTIASEPVMIKGTLNSCLINNTLYFFIVIREFNLITSKCNTKIRDQIQLNINFKEKII